MPKLNLVSASTSILHDTAVVKKIDIPNRNIQKNAYRQLYLWQPPQEAEADENQIESPCTKLDKPQISRVPGISPKQRNRYRVTIDDQVLGNRLSLNEALKLAKTGGEG